MSSILLAPAFAAPSQPIGSLELIADGMDSPSNLASPAAGRIYVTEQYTGRIRVIADGRLLPEPFLDLGDRLIEAPYSEEGLVGLAFSPEFPTTPYVYVTYVNLEDELVLSRFEVAASGLQAIPFSERVLLSAPREERLHHCGHIAFGPKDRLLYLCIGDTLGNARSTNLIEPIAQDPGRFAGKILRLDVEPVPVAGLQPIAAAMPETTYEIWAMGLRNPWRFAFDPLTGDMFIPDVSRDHWNEIDFLPASSGPGANFGWPLAEGNECVTRCDAAGLDWPIYEYDQRENRCAVIGGAVYRGEAYPPWQGVFVFADFCSGEIWALRNAGRKPEIRRIAATDLMPHAIGTRFDGEILVAGGGGAVWRLRLPDSADGGWLPVDRVMFAMITDARRSGFSRSKDYLDRVVQSRTWRWGSIIRKIYRAPWQLFD